MMNYNSILYPCEGQCSEASEVSRTFIHDMELDVLLDTVACHCNDPTPLFQPAGKAETIFYRQQVFQDLEPLMIRRRFIRFSKQIRDLQKYAVSTPLSSMSYTDFSRSLSAADQYTQALDEFLNQFPYSSIHSAGLSAFLHFCRRCYTNPVTVRMRMDIVSIKRELQTVKFLMLLGDDTLRIAPMEPLESIDQRLSALFSRFGESYLSGATCLSPQGATNNRIDNEILNMVSQLYPAIFEKLRDFRTVYRDYIDQRLLKFADDIQIYCGYLDYTDRLKALGLPFCYPEIHADSQDCDCAEAYDLALADSLREASKTPVFNGFSLRDGERIIVVTGPNQGGKTTFARMFGQLHYLAALGFFVPGKSARLKLVTSFYSHFCDMSSSAAEGYLKAELLRLKAITDQANSQSIVIVNEIFASATMADGLLLGRKMLERLTAAGCLGVCVTFLEELASQDPSIVSMVSIVPPDDPGARTYMIRRKPPQGRAFAEYLAESNGLRYEQLLGRMRK